LDPGSLLETIQGSKNPPKPKSVDVERDLIGVGAGPANLSLASLLTTARERGLTSISATFLECEAMVFWHSLQMFPGSLMQTEFYRDLVTPIDPTSKFSFLNYLKAQARLDHFFCSSTIYPTRREFEDYFRWVAGQIGEVIFGVEVILRRLRRHKKLVRRRCRNPRPLRDKAHRFWKRRAAKVRSRSEQVG
jgi:lysine/ornithine N-monooxygenase